MSRTRNTSTESSKADSQLCYGGKRLKEVEALGLTKFSEKFVCANVNRKDQRFEVLVKSPDKKQKEEFETLWPMCRVLSVIE